MFVPDVIFYTFCQFVLLIVYVNIVKYEIKIVQHLSGFFDSCQVFYSTVGGSNATYMMQVKEEEKPTPTSRFSRKF